MAIGPTTFNLAGTAVSDLFKGFGAEAEAGLYRESAAFARENVQFTKESTALKEFQQQRQAYQAIGAEKADIAGAGFAESGTSLDLLRESTQQAALAKETIALQGQITEAGYQQQAASYDALAKAQDLAATGAFIGAAVSGLSAIASVFIPGASGA
jgi:hypothetical protein